MGLHYHSRLEASLFCDKLTFNLTPFAPVESALSLPAKSTRLTLLTFSDSRFVVLSLRFCVKTMVKTACDLLLVSFMLVEATVLGKSKTKTTFLWTSWVSTVCMKYKVRWILFVWLCFPKSITISNEKMIWGTSS